MAPPKRRRRDDDDDEADGPPVGNSQVLPVAALPEDFDGEVLDGATYLALASRENAGRPFVTRVNPAPAAPVLPTPKPSTGERHPLLPRESWIVVFGAHFAAYKRSLAARIASAPREEAVEDDEEEAANGANGDTAEGLPEAYDDEGWIAYVDNTEDEEAALNGAEPREPLASVLRRLDTPTILAVLSYLTPEEALPPHRGRWLFALLAALDAQLDRDEISHLRTFARGVLDFICARYAAAREGGELAAVPVHPGFYATEETQEAPETPETHGWTLGAAWKRDMAARPKSEAMRPDTAGVDAEIARAWVAFHGVVAGWAQHDLVDEAEGAARRLPLPE